MKESRTNGSQVLEVISKYNPNMKEIIGNGDWLVFGSVIKLYMSCNFVNISLNIVFSVP